MGFGWRKSIILVLLICVLLCILTGMIRPKENELKYYIDIWDTGNLLSRSGYDGLDYYPIKMDISLWAPLDETNITRDKMITLLERGAKHCQLHIESLTDETNIEGIKKMILKGRDKDGLSYDIMVLSGEGDFRENGPYTTHLIVNIVEESEGGSPDNPLEDSESHRFSGHYRKVKNFNDERDHISILSDDYKKVIETVEKYFKSEGARPRTVINLKGVLRGELNKKERKDLSKALIKDLEGTRIQTMEEGNLISVAGYSLILPTRPMENVNFQVALRYNEDMDITYIWIGTPIITIEY